MRRGRARGAPPENHDTPDSAPERDRMPADRRAPLRVVLTGAESTGKTELARRLAAHYGAPWTPEFVRGYLDARIGAGGPALGVADIEPIARGQIALEDAAVATASALLLHDTDLASTLVYAEHYYGEAPAWIADAVRVRRADLYLLLDVDVPFTADPQRGTPERRAELHARFVAALAAIDARTIIVRGDWDARFARAVEAIDELR